MSLEQRILARDPTAIDALLRCDRQAVGVYLARVTGERDRHAIDEAINDAALRLWQHPEVIQPARGSVHAWLRAVSRIMYLRIKHHRESHLCEGTGDEVFDSAGTFCSEQSTQEEVPLIARLVREAMASMSPFERVIIEEDLAQPSLRTPTAELAEKHGIKPGTARTLRHRAHKRIDRFTAHCRRSRP